MSALKQTFLLACVLPLLSLAGCKTISEEGCRAGNWEDIGFKDGSQGRSRARLSDIGEDCAKFGIQPDRTAYIAGLEMGLKRYCTPGQGYDDGRDNDRLNQECRSLGYAGYLDAYDDGQDEYLVRRDYADLQKRWSDIEVSILDVEVELDQPDLTSSARRTIRARLRDLENERDDIRVDIRAMEREFDWPRWRPEIANKDDA